MTLSVHHVAFTVRDLDKALRWYQEVLDFKVLRRFEKNAMRIALIESGNLKIELFSFSDETSPLPEYRHELMSDLQTIGVKHLCIEVDDLTLLIGDLREKSVSIRTDVDTAFFGGKYCFISDPDGNLIELHEF